MAGEEPVLHPFLVRVPHFGVERHGVDAFGTQCLGEPFAAFPVLLVDYAAALVPFRPGDHGLEAFAGPGADHREAQVRPVRVGRDRHGVDQVQEFADLPGLRPACGGGQRHGHGARGQGVDEFADAHVAGSEVRSPVQHAVRLVDGEQADADAVAEVGEVGRVQAFGCDVEDAQFAGQGAPVHLGAFLLVQAGVDERGGYAA